MIFLVLPAFNEAANLPPLVETFFAAMKRARLPDARVIIINDGSQDDTQAVAEELARRFPVEARQNPRNLGLAGALKHGLTHASALAADDDVIVTMDGDNTHPPDLIPRMVQRVHEGNDIVIASRYRYGSAIRGVTWDRQLMSLGAAALLKAALPIPGVRDYTCGFRAYGATLLRRAIADLGADGLISEEGFQCMVDVLLKLRRYQPVITEIPLVLRYGQKIGASKMKVASTAAATLRLIARRRLGR